MLKKILFCIIFFSGSARAQNNNQPSHFNNFIKNQNIEWAYNASDSFYFEKLFNDYLICRLQKKEIKATIPFSANESGTNGIHYLKKDSIDKNSLAPGNSLKPTYDENGKLVRSPLFQQHSEASIFNITEVNQILYIEKGALKSYVPWVTPTLPLFISSGAYLGETYYFNTCYNFKRKTRRSKKDEIIFLGNTIKKIPLQNTVHENNLKELYGRNMVVTLWPFLDKNKIDVYSIERNQKINAAELDAGIQTKMPMIVPLYDAVGNVYQYKVLSGDFNPTTFTDVEIEQDWYYNADKNIVFNQIKGLILWLPKWSKEVETKSMPVIKLVFN